MARGKFNIVLSWSQLTWDKLRLCAAVSGIVFAVTLMMMQLGFRDSLFVAAVQFHHALKADLVLLSSQYEYMVATKPFSRRHLYKTLGIDAVQSVTPLYVGLVNWKNSETHREIPIYLIGFNPIESALDLPGVSSNLDEIKLTDHVLFDAGSKPDFGPVPALFRAHGPITTQVGGHKITIAGLFQLGLSFGTDGNLVTSEDNFFRLLPGRRQGLIDMGLIRLRPGSSREAVKAEIQKGLGPGLRLLTRDEFIDYEKKYWAVRTPVGFVFNLGVVVGFIVGAVIVYQILYTDVSDHIGEYATLKAMGYSDAYLYRVVIEESLLLSVLGFIPGFLISTGMGILTRKMTLLPASMTWQRASTVFVLTLVMCVVSGILAMRKLRSADPADIF